MPDAGGGSLPPIAICVPARNEAARLPDLLAAIAALDRDGIGDVTLCVVLDGCTDASAAVMARGCPDPTIRVVVEEVPPSPANAGVARDRAMRLGMASLPGDDGMLLTTDADSRPDQNWLVAMVAALDRADVVAGAVRRVGRHGSGGQDRIDCYYDRLFGLRRRIDPVPWEAAVTHHHVSGASMAMHVGTYRAIGGFAPVANGEDARFADDAARSGHRVRRDAGCVVFTSDRRRGRASGGMAAALRTIDQHGLAEVDVAHPADQLWQYRMHAAARCAFAARRFDGFARSVGIDVDHVVGVARDCVNDEAFAMRIVPTPPDGMRRVSFVTAEAMLAAMADADTPAQAA